MVGSRWGLFTICLMTLLFSAVSLENGLSRTPAMGYSTWNKWGPDINEDIVRETTDLMVSHGLAEAGYSYLVIDDAWSNPTRNDDGDIEPNSDKFPNGLNALSDHIHDNGLKLGMYSDAGDLTCLSYPGSRGHEKQDAEMFASYGVDYLKYDNCYASASDWIVDRYVTMRDALNATGRPITFSMCNWGVAEPWKWGSQVGNSWRTTEDIAASWPSILLNLDNSVGLAKFAGPGGWNDLDILEVGNGKLTINEQRSHFALWALLKSPLMVGTDLSSLSEESLKILLAKEVIAVNQDEMGVAGDLIWKEGPTEIYAGPLSGGSRAVVFFNRHILGSQYPMSNITLHWGSLGYADYEEIEVRDLFAEQDLGTFNTSLTLQVDTHDVRMVKLTPKQSQGGHFSWRPWHVHRLGSQHLVYENQNAILHPRRGTSRV